MMCAYERATSLMIMTVDLVEKRQYRCLNDFLEPQKGLPSMSVTKVWEMLPNADFADRTNWQLLGNDRYAALRGRLLIVQSNGQKSRRGPVIEEYSVAPGDTIGLRRRRERVIKRWQPIPHRLSPSTDRIPAKSLQI